MRATRDEVSDLASGIYHGLQVAGVAIGAPIAGFVAGFSSFGVGMQSATVVSIICALLLIGPLGRDLSSP